MNANLTLSASAISKAIREKKKKLMTSEPSLIDTSPTPDMNAQDVWDTQKRAEYEEKTAADPKINSDETMMNQPEDQAERDATKARSGIEAAGHMPRETREMPERMAMGGEVVPGETDPLSAPPAMGSMMESNEADWNAKKFRRLGRLNAYLDSLDIY